MPFGSLNLRLSMLLRPERLLDRATPNSHVAARDCQIKQASVVENSSREGPVLFVVLRTPSQQTAHDSGAANPPGPRLLQRIERPHKFFCEVGLSNRKRIVRQAQHATYR